MKLEKLLNKFKKKLGKPMKNNQKQKRELNLIIGFGQIGSSIYDRFKYLKNNEDSKNDFDVKVFDIQQYKNENDFVTNKIETIRFGNYGKINFICCIDTKPGQDLFNNPNSNNKTFSSTLLKTFFENKEVCCEMQLFHLVQYELFF